MKAFERTVDTKDEVEYVLEIGDASHIWPSRIRALRSIGQSRLLGDAEIDPAEVGVDGSDLLNLPVIIDDFRGTVSPIAEPFLSPRFLEHRYDVLMVQNGKFARVLGTDGCLEIRATPDPESDVVECVPERALLMRGSRAFESRGETWLAVGTPAGGSGYALTEHLEY